MYIQFFKWILERQPTPLNPMPGFGTKAEALIRLFESIRCLTNSHRKAQSQVDRQTQADLNEAAAAADASACIWPAVEAIEIGWFAEKEDSL